MSSGPRSPIKAIAPSGSDSERMELSSGEPKPRQEGSLKFLHRHPTRIWEKNSAARLESAAQVLRRETPFGVSVKPLSYVTMGSLLMNGFEPLLRTVFRTPLPVKPGTQGNDRYMQLTRYPQSSHPDRPPGSIDSARPMPLPGTRSQSASAGRPTRPG